MRLSHALALSLCLAAPALAQDDEPEEVTAIRKRLPAIRKALVKIRGKEFKSDVAAKYQSEEGFREFMTKSMEEEYPPERIAKIGRLYSRLGLFPEDLDLAKTLVDLMQSQALAYYNPATDTFYMLKNDMPKAEVDPAVLHELQHAIQDQHFELDGLQKRIAELKMDDSETAFRFLVEGEATYVMIVYALELQGMPANMVDMQINAAAGLDREGLMRLQKMQMQMQGGTKSQEESLAAMEKAPRYLYRMLSNPYYGGALMVSEVKKRGGWKAIDALWKNPPRSTEQALHPEKLSGADRDEPMHISLPDVSAAFGEGWSQAESNAIGELGMRTVFRELVGDDQVDACAGWDGDRAVSYEHADRKSAAVVWHTTWDSAGEAKQFASAYKKALFKKYGAEGKVVDGVLVFSKGDEEVLMTLADTDVLIIEGAPKGKAKAIMEATLAGAKKVEYAGLTADERPETGDAPKTEPKREAH